MTDKPIIDVAILAANYNNGRFLEEFMESILSSTVLPSQMIIVDDGSTDDSVNILRKYETVPGATFIYLAQNTGFGNALNTGISAITSTYVMRADPDDLILPQKMEKQNNYLIKHPELCGIGCNVEYFRNTGAETIHKSMFPLTIEAVTRSYQNGEHGLQHPTVMLKAEIFRQFTYNQNFVPAEDYDIFARMLNSGYLFANLKEALYRMRIHPDSISSRINFDTVKKTCELRKDIFNRETPVYIQKIRYWHILNYRKYLLEKNRCFAYRFLLSAILCQPQKLLKRLGIP